MESVFYSISPFSDSEPFSQAYSNGHLHDLPTEIWKMDYFLVQAPEEIETIGYSETKKWELQESTPDS